MSDDICHRFNGNLQRRRDGRSVNQIRRQHTIALAWVTKTESLSYGECLNVVQKASILCLLGSLVFVGLYLLGKEKGRGEGRY